MKNFTRSTVVIAATLAALVTPAAAKKPIVWETGLVISQNTGAEQVGAYAAPIGGGTFAVPLYRRWNVATVDVGQYICQWQEQTTRSNLILVANESFHFYRDGNWFIVRDVGGKAHKFGLISMTKK